MEFYRVTQTTLHNNTFIGNTIGIALLAEEPQPVEIKITWDNLQEIYSHYNCKFNIWNTKRGKRVSFFVDDILPHFKDKRDVKEWKQIDLNITLKVTYRKFTPSLEEVIKWHNAEQAIAYLKEKGLDKSSFLITK